MSQAPEDRGTDDASAVDEGIAGLEPSDIAVEPAGAGTSGDPSEPDDLDAGADTVDAPDSAAAAELDPMSDDELADAEGGDVDVLDEGGTPAPEDMDDAQLRTAAREAGEPAAAALSHDELVEEVIDAQMEDAAADETASDDELGPDVDVSTLEEGRDRESGS